MVSDIWQEFLKIAKEEAGSRVVETWFKAVALERWDPQAKIVYLHAPNSFVQDWIKGNYVPLIETHLKRLLHVDSVKVNFSASTPNLKSHLSADFKAGILTVAPQPMEKTNHHSLTAPIKKMNPGRLYSFDTFVVGSNNSLAYAAAQAVADKPGTIYNPLFIYGQSGLGKTHLLHAIGNEIKLRHKKAVTLYQTADRFVNEFIHAIRFDKVHQFQAKYKSVDALLIDDIQFISKKEQTQEAFFHIFNTLYDAQKQIIFTSDAFPHDIAGIAERLKYRLSWGLVVDMHVPTLETKIAILKKKSEVHAQQLPDDVAHFIASQVISNIRELEGSLIRVMAFASLTNQSITVPLAQKVLTRVAEVKTATIHFDTIIKSITRYYNVDMAALRSKNRSKELSLVRQVAMFFMKKLTEQSLRDIGIYVGGRDHSTVLHAIEKIAEKMESNQEFKNILRQIEDDIIAQV